MAAVDAKRIPDYRLGMSLQHQVLHEGKLLHVGCVCCRPESPACGELEHTGSNTVAFPLRGVFVKHHDHGADVVAHAGQVLFFKTGEEYRVSHPATGGDDCLVLRADDAVLREILMDHDARRAERADDPFRTTHLALPAAIELQRSLLWHRLRSNEASTLEAETRGLSLLNQVLARVSPEALQHDPKPPSRRSRRREQSHAVAVLLADKPARDWSLDELAARVHSSPFHLARSFRAALGEPIHRYQLRIRLALALEQVLDATAPLTTVAMELGFATPSHFTAAFGRAYGITPSALRKQARPSQVRLLRKILTANRSCPR
ncbi:helix-turn-helix transcriptional regulator [Dyella choica]|nr:AraC family transcriptional regulator [Dyella choica]